MKKIKIASAQFEHRSNDKPYNLQKIEELAAKAKNDGADVIAFHELCITGYSFLLDLSKSELKSIAEIIPEGQSIKRIKEISEDLGIIILAGLVESFENKVYNSYFAVDGDKLLAVYRKIHPFINPHIAPGEGYVFFNIKGWKCSILICYDNNIIENVRAVTLEGTQILFAPHVTGGTPSPAPGRGYIGMRLWENRVSDPVSIRNEILGPKGRGWLMKWLPARAFDNGIYVIFSNAIGLDHDHIKNGNSMIIDPFGDILSEVNTLGDDFVVGLCEPKKLMEAGGYRYRKARKPEIYSELIGMPHKSETRPIWMKDIE